MKIRSSLFQPYFQIALLLLIVLALYSESLHTPFVFDDYVFFASPDNLTKYSLTHLSFDLRWLPYSSLSWTVN